MYGLSAMVDLAERAGGGPVQIRDIAERQNIPQHYLEQILVVLKKGGLVKSFRGAQGGYTLSRNADLVRVIDILEQLEGQLEVVPEGKKDGALHFFWSGLARVIFEYVDMSLAELILEKNTQSFTYSI